MEAGQAVMHQDYSQLRGEQGSTVVHFTDWDENIFYHLYESEAVCLTSKKGQLKIVFIAN